MNSRNAALGIVTTLNRVRLASPCPKRIRLPEKLSPIRFHHNGAFQTMNGALKTRKTVLATTANSSRERQRRVVLASRDSCHNRISKKGASSQGCSLNAQASPRSEE